MPGVEPERGVDGGNNVSSWRGTAALIINFVCMHRNSNTLFVTLIDLRDGALLDGLVHFVLI